MTDPLRIAVLQTGRTIPEALDAHGDYDEMCKAMIGRAPDQAETFAVLDGDFPPSLDPYDVIVITGSKHGIYEDLPWIAPTEDLIRQAMQDGKRMIGICFGHQIMAQALGGRAEKSEKGLGVGLMPYDFISSDGSRTRKHLYAWHQDQVLEAPPGTKVIATSDFCPIAGLRYGDQAISLQPHPEFTKAYMTALIEARCDSHLGPEASEKALVSMEKPSDSVEVRQMLQSFMEARPQMAAE
ncbi:MAG: type 1 glutamine amidotransferase [Pseudomonadota bacterium]